MDLFDARAREALFGVFLPRSRLASAEEPIASRVLTEPFELALHTAARGDANASDLGAEEDEVQEGEGGREAGLRRERFDARLPEGLVTDEGIERDDPRHDREARDRSPERGDEGDEHVGRRREATGQGAVETEERGVEAHRQEGAELEVENERRVPREAELRAHAPAEEEHPGERSRDRDGPERLRRAPQNDVGRKGAGHRQ
ncbi:MAG: hypothetical protein IAF58_06105, partial [Leptolyngbya sp.]|nr:hypothetical protein [Candidatus Melainabacteria bacterium]